MRVRNTTTISNRAIRDVANFVMPPGITNVTIKVQNRKDWYSGHGGGRCVTLRIAPPDKYPLRPVPPHGGYLGSPWLANRMEALVFLMAHELRHCWQSKIKRGRRVWGSRGQYSERDADAYALRMLRAWRRRGSTHQPTED